MYIMLGVCGRLTCLVLDLWVICFLVKNCMIWYFFFFLFNSLYSFFSYIHRLRLHFIDCINDKSMHTFYFHMIVNTRGNILLISMYDKHFWFCSVETFWWHTMFYLNIIIIKASFCPRFTGPYLEYKN